MLTIDHHVHLFCDLILMSDMIILKCFRVVDKFALVMALLERKLCILLKLERLNEELSLILGI